MDITLDLREQVTKELLSKGMVHVLRDLNLTPSGLKAWLEGDESLTEEVKLIITQEDSEIYGIKSRLYEALRSSIKGIREKGVYIFYVAEDCGITECINHVALEETDLYISNCAEAVPPGFKLVINLENEDAFLDINRLVDIASGRTVILLSSSSLSFTGRIYRMPGFNQVDAFKALRGKFPEDFLPDSVLHMICNRINSSFSKYTRYAYLLKSKKDSEQVITPEILVEIDNLEEISYDFEQKKIKK